MSGKSLSVEEKRIIDRDFRRFMAAYKARQEPSVPTMFWDPRWERMEGGLWPKFLRRPTTR